MAKVAIITDSSAGITKSEMQDNLFVVPMPFLINGEEFYEDVNLTQEQFYEMLKNDYSISTSQPSYDEVTKIWNKALETYEQVVYIPLSSALSSSCDSAKTYASEGYKDKVFVVDNLRVSVTQKASVFEALEMAKKGISAKQIAEHLEKSKLDTSIYITIPNLKYLKKGGRVTPAAAALAGLFSIKPVLKIQGEKLDSFAKTMNFTQAKSKMILAINKDIDERFLELKNENKLSLAVAHTQNFEMAEKFKEEIEKAIPNIPVKYVDPLSLIIACHIGPGAIAVAVSRNQM